MNKNIKYMVETVSGGSIVKIFNTITESNTYYNDNIQFNAHQYILKPFQCDGNEYYYSIGNCIGVFNSHCEWITRIDNLDINNFTMQELCKSFTEWSDNWEMPY